MKWLFVILLVATFASADPRPDEAAGVETEDKTPTRHHLLWIPRTMLFVPRAAIWVAAQPIRGAAYAFEKYELREYFFSDTGSYGAYPVARYESRYGFTGGARFIHTNLFGDGERLGLRADVGGRYRQAYGIRATTGNRLGRFALVLDARYEVLPRERFYGIGNAADMDIEFHENAFRNVLALEVGLPGNFAMRTAGALMLRELEGPVPMAGFEDGVHNLYVEQELAYDSRRPASAYQSEALVGTGWLVAGHVGLTRGVDGDRSAFATYGGEVQRYFDLYEGTRTLALRVLAETVVGDEAISFIDLPRLGGTEYLRGYPYGRFRDRAIALASIEYAWDLGNYLAAYTFVDTGRVFHSLADVDLQDLRLGYGGGIQIHTWKSFLMRVQLAASREGDVIFEFSLSPAFGRRERAGRF